jgi:uncharacterized membrane protein YdbT with pleckstrin-like domain
MQTQQPTGPQAETVIWSGRPSHVIYVWRYVVCIVLAVGLIPVVFALQVGFVVAVSILSLVMIPVVYALWTWLQVRMFQYTLTTERLQLRAGILTKRTDSLELYRVRDTVVREPLIYRMLGLGNIETETSDRTHPVFVLRAVKRPHEIHEHLRRQVEQMRMRKGVREVDFE